jgi:hypothetical protein
MGLSLPDTSERKERLQVLAHEELHLTIEPRNQMIDEVDLI